MGGRSRLTALGFDQMLFIGVILLMVTSVALAAGFYVLPAEHLRIPELQPVIRVALESEFPVGSSRLRTVGEKTILIIRADEQSYAALEGISPVDGCILRWDDESRRIQSPCAYAVFGLRGEVVAGLTRESLERYPVSVRDGVVYVHLESGLTP